MGKSYGENNIWAGPERTGGILLLVVMKDTPAIGKKTNKHGAEKVNEKEKGK